MKTQKLSLNSAISEVKAHRPCICPNDGFLDQLRLFESMRCKLDKSFLPYKLYKLTQIHQQVSKAKILPSHVKKALEIAKNAKKAENHDEKSPNSSPASQASSGGKLNSLNGNKGENNKCTVSK